MKRRRKQRDNFVQSLFPFLAVLLSTMGALVLLLMLIVNQAQATAKQMAVEKKTQIENAESNLELIRNSFEEQLDDRRLELERKRLTLQHLEKHINELIQELKDIERTAVLLGQKQSKDKTEEVETERKITQLEKQLTDANIDLKKKLDKPEGNKPIFAIIPYQGTNGTHRRPIYLECTSQGVTIQPEGVLIGLADLRPPYGPGNPLDAAIRTVRSHFVPANGALTSTAYPLLIVRPSGVRSYAMARQAMSGWDDQFGYELVNDSLELTFPESEPGIVPEIEQALVQARERQAALVMAMPAKYRSYISQGGSNMESLEFGDDGGDMGDEWAGGAGSSSGGGAAGSNSSTGYRGGFAASQGGTTGQRGTGGGAGAKGGTGQRAGQGQPGSQMGFGSGNAAGDTEGTSFFANGGGQPGGEGSYFGSGANGSGAFNSDSTGSGSATSGGTGTNANSSQGFTGNQAQGGNGEFANTSSRTNGQGSGGNAGGGGAYGDASGGSGSGGSGGGGQAGGRQGGTANTGSGKAGSGGGGSANGSAGSMAMSGANAGGGAASGAAGTSMGSAAAQDPTVNTGNPSDPAQMGSPSINMDMSRNNQPGQNQSGQRDSQSEPVAQQRGRNWAWREGPPTKTPVVRAIRVVCYNDRWVLMQDNASTSNQVTVPIGKSPQASAEKLAKAITDRVSGWGIALGGGYWKPELIVDVAPGAEARYGQLERLLEGSGLKVQRRANVK